MKASDFFRKEIKDNNYQGYNLAKLKLEDDFYCNTYKKRNPESICKLGIQSFVLEVYEKLAHKKLSELNITQITFDEEFEANKDQKVFEISGTQFDSLNIYTGNIVGSIIYKSHQFNINCRFGNEFLQYMIASTSGFLELENFGAIDADMGLGEWLLTYYWKLQLKKAFSLGIYKTYQKKRENLPVIRGNIDINTILKKQYFDGRTVCNFKEHSYHNELNTVIWMALNKVFRSKYESIVNDIYNIKTAFDSINLSQAKLNQVNNHKVINPYFKKYNQVFDLSLKILKDEFANIGESNTDFSAFLFDVSLLFEHHIRKTLKQQFKIFPKNKQEFTVPNGIYESKLFPDIIIDFGNNEIGIYDVKYKNFDYRDGVNREDRFQLVTYVATYLAKYKVVECGIIYPIEEADLGKVANVKLQTLKVGAEEIPFQVKFYPVCKEMKNQLSIDREFIRQIKGQGLYKNLQYTENKEIA